MTARCGSVLSVRSRICLRRWRDREPMSPRSCRSGWRQPHPSSRFAEIVGNGPYRFLPEEHISGARAAYERFPLYQPRSSSPAGFTTGPKVVHFDRVEWLTLDPFSAMAALQAGEIDWWELPPTDLLEQLARARDVTVISQYATAMGVLRFNHLHPPFNNVAVRRALLGAVDQ